MKELDWVKFIKDRDIYREEGAHVGDVGLIVGGERNGVVLVEIQGEIVQDEDGVYGTTDKYIGAYMEDLEVVKEGK